jgi:putative hydrolase of the HAD superfamily
VTTASVILFDLDDTLFAHREAVDAGAATTLRTLDPELDEDAARAEVARWTELEEHHYHRYLSGELDYLGQRRARARDFVAPYGVDLSADEAAEAWFLDYLHGYRDAWMLHEESLSTMSALRSADPGVRFGLITNGDLDFQMAKLDVLRLTPHLEHIIASGEVGVTKIALELFGVAAHEAVYVGDRLRTDAIGAASVGMLGIWLNRHGIVPASEDRAQAAALGVRTIRKLTELPNLLTA